MFRKLALGVCILFVASSAFAANKEQERLENSGTVLQEVMDVPDNIPQELLEKAECIIVFPSVLKAAFVIGGSYGRGAMVCRTGEHFKGSWGSPAMYALEGGSIGFQLGGEATDLVLLVMNERGASSILSSKVKLGADLSAAAGPKGRDASADTDASPSKVPRFAPMMTPAPMSMAARSQPGKSCWAEKPRSQNPDSTSCACCRRTRRTTNQQKRPTSSHDCRWMLSRM